MAEGDSAPDGGAEPVGVEGSTGVGAGSAGLDVSALAGSSGVVDLGVAAGAATGASGF